MNAFLTSAVVIALLISYYFAIKNVRELKDTLIHKAETPGSFAVLISCIMMYVLTMNDAPFGVPELNNWVRGLTGFLWTLLTASFAQSGMYAATCPTAKQRLTAISYAVLGVIATLAFGAITVGFLTLAVKAL